MLVPQPTTQRIVSLSRPPPSSPSAPPSPDYAAILTSRLAAELSHDLRVPLSSIVAGLEMLEEKLDDHPDPAVAAFLVRTTRAAYRMMRMLDQNMDIDPVPVDRVFADVDLAKVAYQLAVDSAELLERADARLEILDLPVVRADEDEMYSVLQNLLTNAVKFRRPEVRPRISISASRVADAWRVSVTDNGVGIPAPRRIDVFSPFTRLNPGVEGHGIGLGTVARTLHTLGGRVGADEAPGGGAEVWFELPGSPDA